MPVSLSSFKVATQTEDVIGEVPLWDPRAQVLTWIDILKPAFHRFDPASGTVTSVTPPEKLGSYALAKDGGLLTSGRGGIGLWNPATGDFERLATPEADRPNNILNDGRADSRGRFLTASMDKMLGGPNGRLWRIDPLGKAELLQGEDIMLPNSICWSPDGRTFYLGDSHSNLIFAYDYDVDSGAISNKRLFADTKDLPGDVDGSSADAEGYLWNARFAGSCLIRFSPDGKVDQIIETPVSKPTHLAFGGKDLKTIYVTTARFRVSAEDLEKEPLAGALLTMESEVAGLSEALWG
jgi:L-arabinonolactonase